MSGTPPEVMLVGEAELAPDRPESLDVWRRKGDGGPVRAFQWGSLTSGEPVTALWLTLLPYMLVNVAGWALPPGRPWRHRPAVALVRLLGLLLTAIFSLVTAVGFIGLGGFQVIGGAVRPEGGLAAGAAASVLLIGGLWVVTSRGRHETDGDRPSLRPLHVAVALWAVGRVLGTALLEMDPGRAGWRYSNGPASLAVPALATAVVVASSTVRIPDGWVRRAGQALATAAGGLLAVATVGTLTGGRSMTVPSSLRTIDDPLAGAIVAYAVAVAVTSAAALSRRAFDAAPTVAALTILAGGSGAAVGAALIWVSAQVTGALPPDSLGPTAQGFLAGLLAVVVVGLAVFVASLGGTRPVAGALLRAGVLTRERIRVVLVAVPVVAVAILVAVVEGIRRTGGAPPWLSQVAGVEALVLAALAAFGAARLRLWWATGAITAAALGGWWLTRVIPLSFTGVAVTVTLVLPLALVVTRVVGAVRNRDRRRALAVPWDVGSFFPRRFHPFAPPAYGPTAVARLRTALRHYAAEGRPVLLACHSQGSVVGASALAEAGGGHPLAFLTFGSPVGTLYRRFFPRHFDEAFLARVETAAAGRWVNLWRETDPIGGPVAWGGVADTGPAPDPRLRSHGGYWLPDEEAYAGAREQLLAEIDVAAPE